MRFLKGKLGQRQLFLQIVRKGGLGGSFVHVIYVAQVAQVVQVVLVVQMVRVVRITSPDDMH